MTESRAIELLEYIRETGNGEAPYVGCAQNIAIEMAINALEKQIPKKIAKYDVCPVCNNNQSTTWYYVGSSYCEICGQKLDWDE